MLVAIGEHARHFLGGRGQHHGQRQPAVGRERVRLVRAAPVGIRDHGFRVDETPQVGYDYDAEFVFGLDLILDALEQRLPRRTERAAGDRA